MKKLKILNQNGDLTGFGIVFVAIMALVISLLFDVGANAIHAVTATSVESGVYGYGLSAYYERARIEEFNVNYIKAAATTPKGYN